MKCSDTGIGLIKEAEGFRGEVYDDIGGQPTIGYGHLLRKGETFSRITESQATSLLCQDLKTAEACISDKVDVDLSQNQFDALCSFVYNLGCLSLETSTLRKKLNAGDYYGAASEFPKWSYCKKTKSNGLVNRRAKEQALFLA